MFRLLLLCFSIAAFAQTITYTGFSEVSQKAAEEEAAAGVAKQISSTTTTEMVVSRGESRVDGKTALTKDMRVRHIVKSELFLKGLKFVTEPKQGKNFVATASVNLQELTSASRVALENIQKTVSEKERLAREAVAKGSFAEADRLLDESESAARPYKQHLDEISVYLTVTSSMLLKSDVDKIRAELLQSLRGVVLEVPQEKLVVENNEPLQFKIAVKKAGTPLAGFPVYADHDGKRVAEVFSDAAGYAVVKIPAEALLKKPYTITVSHGVNLRYRKEAGLASQVLDYDLKREQCKMQLQCDEGATCGEIMQNLSLQLGDIVEYSSATPVRVSVNAQARRTVKKLSSYDVTLRLEKGEYSCTQNATGVGNGEDDAVRNAVTKMDLAKCGDLRWMCK